jgi:quinol-cytochrome oxidoreductase complex cytochrome b subunit
MTLFRSVVVLCTLAVIMSLAILPALLEMAGIGHAEYEQPANPREGTPPGIKPEWYFLGVYEYLRLMPTDLLGIDGKTLGVLSQGVVVLAFVLLPFWYRRKANQRPGWRYRLGITAVVAVFLGLTFLGAWPEEDVGGEIKEVPLGKFVAQHYMMFLLTALALMVFYLLLAHERQAIRRVLYGPPPEGSPLEGPPPEGTPPSPPPTQEDHP